MPHLLLKKIPRYECLLEGAKQFPALDPSSCEAFLHLLRAGDEAFGAAERNLSRFNLSQGRFGVIMLLWKSGCSGPGPRTPAELADAAGVTRATMTGLIDTLERDGLVRREPHPDDRRMMSVHLTPKAQELLPEVLPSHFEVMTRLMESISESERRLLVRLLARIHRSEGSESEPTGSVSLPEAALRS